MNTKAARLGAFRVCLAVGVLSVVGGCASQHLLTVEDTVCRVDERSRLVGKFEQRGILIFNSGQEDRELRFFINGYLVGIDETNDEGYARIRHRFEETGVYRLTVLAEGGPGRLVESQASVFVWDRSIPILIVDIDDTISQTRKRTFLSISRDDSSSPMPGAAQVLQELAEDFHIVYLTARPREMIPKTRRWIQTHDFPFGPLLAWDIDRHEWSADEYKKERIDTLQDDFKLVTIGIGNTEKDHEAYHKRKVFSIMINPEGAPALIDHGVQLPDWFTVRRFFEENPHLYGQPFSDKTPVKLPAESLGGSIENGS